MLRCCFTNDEPLLHEPLEIINYIYMIFPYLTRRLKNSFRIKLFIKTIANPFFFTIVLSNIALSNHT
mgnify:CR=1 FL=1